MRALRPEERLFGPGAVARRVHGDVTKMLVGGVSGSLLQMLHPAVLAGVWDHSDFRADMQGRLSRTARFIAVTTYGSRADAGVAIARVGRIHDRVRGVLPNGTPYAANDPSLLISHQAVGYALTDAKMAIEAIRSLSLRAAHAFDTQTRLCACRIISYMESRWKQVRPLDAEPIVLL